MKRRSEHTFPFVRAFPSASPFVEVMAQLADPAPWGRSTTDTAFLELLVADGVLPPNTDLSRPEWIAPTPEEGEPQPPSIYVVHLARLHEQGFGIPAGRFISQVAVFVAVCEGYLGVEAHWELWKHLFRGELYTERAQQGPRRATRAGGLTLQVSERRGDLYIPCKMTTNNAGWSRGWFYLCNDGRRLLAYTCKILREKPVRWGYGVSPPKR